ncbi:MAG: hypothetical protein JWR05_2503 [Mucilaginibacter sp.]|nr:hypothetical protein [Mucilaginibacter sp.]
MDDKFDKDLANRIREVFEDYQYPPADEGWTQLRKKFPAEEKNNKIAWLWWSSVAAVALVFLAMGLWLLKPEKPVENVANNTTVKSTHKNSVAANNKANTTVTGDNIALQKHAELTPAEQAKKQQATDALQNNKYNNNLAKSYPRAIPQPESFSPAISATVHYPVTKTAPEKTPMAIAVTPKILPDSQRVINNNTEQQIVKNDQPVVVNNSNNAIKQEVQPPKNIIDLMKGEKANTVAKKEAQNKQDNKKVNFSVYAATYLNYASGSANQINAGAGFTSDIKLSKNIKLSTGISLAQNTLRYDNAPPSNSAKIFSSAPANTAIMQANAFVTKMVLSVPEFKNYNARLIGLDIPVNIKYAFNPQKNDTYISAGLSSGTFIDERYTYSYQYKGNNAAGTNLVPPQDETTSRSFNSFYFGKTLNVSFGMGYPLGKSNRLIIEPFLKYPLEGLGAQQIRFGAGGLNLKINFKGTKK